MQLAIVDYDAGNLRNVQKAIEHLGCRAAITACPDGLESADALVLPGVGAFHDGMDALESLGLRDALRQEVLERHKPILGICLGMQLLAGEGFEGGPRQGLGIVPASVRRLEPQGAPLRLPHIGWNSVRTAARSRLFRGIPDGADFYFVHSFHVDCQDDTMVAATAEYGRPFVAALEGGRVFATQFHPEKSQRYGLRLLKNFLQACSAGAGAAAQEARDRGASC